MASAIVVVARVDVGEVVDEEEEGADGEATGFAVGGAGFPETGAGFALGLGLTAGGFEADFAPVFGAEGGTGFDPCLADGLVGLGPAGEDGFIACSVFCFFWAPLGPLSSGSALVPDYMSSG
jgi:hypothetical protein